MKNNDVVILAAKRSPIGRMGKTLKDWTAPELAGPVIKQVIEGAGVGPQQVDRVIMGHVLSHGGRQHPAKQAAVAGGLSHSVPAHSVNKVCASSLQALWDASHFAQLENELVVAGGMESMSNATEDHLLREGLTDAYGEGGCHMGDYADQLALRHPYFLSREAQDEYAVESHRRAREAESSIPEDRLGIASGYPISFDEGIRDTSMDKLARINPIFGKTITAGNASQRSDGAAAVLVSTYKRAKELNIEPMARIVDFADYSHEPEMYTTAPVSATNRVLTKAGLLPPEIDLLEVNEAFAVVPLYYMEDYRHWFKNALHGRLNIWGGAIALGHPIGASGARIVVTLIHVLRYTGGRYGMAVACHGGGGAVAVIIENLQR